MSDTTLVTATARIGATRQRHASGEAYTAQVAQSVAGDDRKEQKACPDEAMEHDVHRRETGRNAVARRDEADGPEQGRARAAEDTDEIEPRRRRRAGGRLRRLHGASRAAIVVAASLLPRKVPW